MVLKKILFLLYGDLPDYLVVARSTIKQVRFDNDPVRSTMFLNVYCEKWMAILCDYCGEDSFTQVSEYKCRLLV